jgi:peptidoglycan/xylan/chitin deacetylase (PgdA/CDA1 family)
MHRGGRSRVLVLLYHRVLPGRKADDLDRFLSVSWEQFTAQMDVLAAAKCAAPLGSMAEEPSTDDRPIRVAVTFDDGYADVLEYALPILQQRHIPATVFLTTGFCDGSTAAWWEQIAQCLRVTCSSGSERTLRYRELVRRYQRRPPTDRKQKPELAFSMPANSGSDEQRKFLTPDEVRWAAGRGLTFENHTHSHICVAALSEDEMSYECGRAASLITAWTGRTPQVFAFPGGGWHDISPRSLRTLARAGYPAAFASASRGARWHDWTSWLRRAHIRVLPRRPVEWTTTMEEFRSWLT